MLSLAIFLCLLAHGSKADISIKSTRLSPLTIETLVESQVGEALNQEPDAILINGKLPDRETRLVNIDSVIKKVGLAQSQSAIALDAGSKDESVVRAIGTMREVGKLESIAKSVELQEKSSLETNREVLPQMAETPLQPLLSIEKPTQSNPIVLKEKNDDSTSGDAQSTDDIEMKEVYMCDPNFKNLLFKKAEVSGDVPAISATKFMRDNCKGFKYSCCTQKELIELFNTVTAETEAIKKLKMDLKRFTSYLKTVSSSFFNEMKVTKDELYTKCNPRQPKEVTETIQVLKDQADILYAHMSEYLFKSMSSLLNFACSICAYDNNSFFTIKRNPGINESFYKVIIKHPDEIMNFYRNEFELFRLPDLANLVAFFMCYMDEAYVESEINDIIMNADVRKAVEQNNISYIAQSSVANVYFKHRYLAGSFSYLNFDMMLAGLISLVEGSPLRTNGPVDIMLRLISHEFSNNNPEVAIYHNVYIKVVEAKKGYNSKTVTYKGNAHIKQFKEILQINSLWITKVAALITLLALWF